MTGTETLHSSRLWRVGDRCRVERFGEWRNGTIVAIAYAGEVAMVLRDGESAEKAFPVRSLVGSGGRMRTAHRTQIRTMHRYGFRCGQWADLLTTVPAPDKSDCYLVRFEDGATDYWVVNDPDSQYEFREVEALV